MKHLLTLLASTAAVAVCGCNFTGVKRGDTHAINSRWFWNTEGFEMETSTNGTRIKIQKSNPDAESLKAVAAGAAEGAVKGASPAP